VLDWAVLPRKLMLARDARARRVVSS